MEHEKNKIDPNGLVEIWRHAEQRRMEEIGRYLGEYFAKRQSRKTSEPETSYPQAKPLLR